MRKAPHGKNVVTLLGRFALKEKHDWLHAIYASAQDTINRHDYPQKLHVFRGTIVTNKHGESEGEFSVWGNTSLDRILEGKLGESIVIEVSDVSVAKLSSGDEREYPVYRFSLL